MKHKFKLNLYLGIVILFLYLPIFVLIVFAFNSTKSRTVFSGFTIQWFAELFKDSLIMNALFNSLILAVLSSIIATVIGTVAALQILKMKKIKQSIIMNLNFVSVINSEVVMGVSLMMLFVFVLNIIGGELGFITVLIAHITFIIPYVVLTMLPKIRQIDPNILDAALDLGCTPSRAFFKVILPQIMPGIASSLIMGFSLSFDDFAVSYFTTGSSFQTLPVLIYSMTRKRITPKINALFTLIFVLVFIMLIVMNILDIRSEKNKKKKSAKIIND